MDKKPVGMDIADIPLVRALEKAGLEIVDGQEVMLEARIIKTKDEIELLKTSAAMVDAAYEEVVRNIKPGARENDLVAAANHVLYHAGFRACGVRQQRVRARAASPIPTPFLTGSFVRETWSFWISCTLTTATGPAITARLSAENPQNLNWKPMRSRGNGSRTRSTRSNPGRRRRMWPKRGLRPDKFGLKIRRGGLSPSVRPRRRPEHLGETGDLKAVLTGPSLQDRGRDGLRPGNLLSFLRRKGRCQDRRGGGRHERRV